MSRPELIAPPEIYYGDIEAKKYTGNTRNQQIQADMTYRALELLNLPPDEPAFLLDIGCGSGLSGEILDEEGYIWTGVDIAPSMLEVALEREFRWRHKHLRPAMAPQRRNLPPHILPPHRLTRFFTTLHSSLRNPSRAVFQFYPSSDDQIQLITSIAQKAGFGGGIVVDYPNSKKAKKVFLCLYVGGGGGAQQLPEGLDGEEKSKNGGKRKSIKDKDWILKKKELYRKRGKEGVPKDSKFTGRKRRAVF
ncbi:S-adenosyl-L-methionine-dependent methyltransferase [Mycena galopus ATCC 62051]|nr:S-adenosyl-L-methionine-dependent methyltransferase [Mycena galopus ATCC 62051]